MLSICVCTHNQLVMTAESVEVLLKHADEEGELILYDDCSIDGTAAYFEAETERLNKLGPVKLKFIKGEVPHYTGSFGKALTYADPSSDLYITMDSDVVYVPPRWTSWIRGKFDALPEMGVMVLIDVGYYRCFQWLFGMKEWDDPLDINALDPIEKGGKGGYGHGAFMACRARDYRLVGGMPSTPGWALHDCELQIKINRGMGKKVYVFKELPMIHLSAAGRRIFYGYEDKIEVGH